MLRHTQDPIATEHLRGARSLLGWLIRIEHHACKAAEVGKETGTAVMFVAISFATAVAATDMVHVHVRAWDHVGATRQHSVESLPGVHAVLRPSRVLEPVLLLLRRLHRLAARSTDQCLRQSQF